MRLSSLVRLGGAGLGLLFLPINAVAPDHVINRACADVQSVCSAAPISSASLQCGEEVDFGNFVDAGGADGDFAGLASGCLRLNWQEVWQVAGTNEAVDGVGNRALHDTFEFTEISRP